MKRFLIAFIPIAVLVAVINILSPLMSFAVALIGWKIERK